MYKCKICQNDKMSKNVVKMLWSNISQINQIKQNVKNYQKVNVKMTKCPFKYMVDAGLCWRRPIFYDMSFQRWLPQSLTEIISNKETQVIDAALVMDAISTLTVDTELDNGEV